MLDLEAKISSFRKMVWDEEKEKSEKELYQSTEDNSKLVSDKKAELEKHLEDSVKDRQIFAETRKNENVSKKEFESKNDIFLYRQSLLEDLIKRIKENLRDFTNTKDYKDKLTLMIDKALEELGLSKEEVIISVLEKDKKLIDFPNVEVLDDEYIGGFIISNLDRDFRYNYTYLNRLKDKKYEVGKKLNQLLESESFNESKN
ncbi:MAG: V-type ATP synthase subunit E [Anaerococcus sp.]|uniref:V-type ATP synthase subunit E n=1 Tax=Anaerococcus sp. TaxID=1872515 RepID=UPI00262006B3|nr:V-type ATP synthase subunit E [Anaerococcus sp.]MCI5972324.1 V-type ATP synthase subunit E [Anaerococcus sp.]MDD6918788.1 V-type ATP synthase subunit E [Peptoniphilaceae bacterium]MDY2927335.1 V-type ATP synthase subunit E [Anaerococcus sp.]